MSGFVQIMECWNVDEKLKAGEFARYFAESETRVSLFLSVLETRSVEWCLV